MILPKLRSAAGSSGGLICLLAATCCAAVGVRADDAGRCCRRCCSARPLARPGRRSEPPSRQRWCARSEPASGHTSRPSERHSAARIPPRVEPWRWAGSQEAIGSEPSLTSEERTPSCCLDESYQVCCVGHHQNARSGVLMVRACCTVDAWITHQVEETPRSRAESAAAAAVTAVPALAARTPPRFTAPRAAAAEAQPSPQLSSAAAPGWSRPGKGAVAEVEGADPLADHGAAGTRAASSSKISPPATAKPPAAAAATAAAAAAVAPAATSPGSGSGGSSPTSPPRRRRPLSPADSQSQPRQQPRSGGGGRRRRSGQGALARALHQPGGLAAALAARRQADINTPEAAAAAAPTTTQPATPTAAGTPAVDLRSQPPHQDGSKRDSVVSTDPTPVAPATSSAAATPAVVGDLKEVVVNQPGPLGLTVARVGGMSGKPLADRLA